MNEEKHQSKMTMSRSSTPSNDSVIFTPNSSPPSSPACDEVDKIHGLRTINTHDRVLANYASPNMASSDEVYVHFMMRQLGLDLTDIDFLTSKSIDWGSL